VLARLDRAAFEKCLLGWIRAVQEVTENRLIAIDGKALRGSYDRGDGEAAIHKVSAWAAGNKLSLGQVVGEKSNEITATPELIRVPELSGAVVTIDAMGCQKEVADLVREGDADYVLAVKQDQPALHERVEEVVGAGLEQDTAAVDMHRTVEAGHGRRETRTYVIFPATEAVDPDGLWRDLKAVGMAVTESTDTQGRCRP
jgi:predicted transposase YbfD/YdcC